jgi:hypothetical protein
MFVRLEAKDADTVSIEDLVVARVLLSRYEIPADSNP